jgi:hypothetical protein
LRAIRLRDLLYDALQIDCGALSPNTSRFGHDYARLRAVICRSTSLSFV